MLRDIYAPSDFDSIDNDPSVPVQSKLSVIADTPVRVVYSDFIENFGDEFDLELPYGVCASFDLCTHIDGRVAEQPYLYCERIDVGDRALCGYGIGTRLLRSAVRYGLEIEPRLHTFCTGWARLGLLNTAVKVFGESSVAVIREAGAPRYGWGSDKPLDAIFDDLPPLAGQPYLLYSTESLVNYETAIRWELPVSQTDG